jgi:hypothetical protein
VPSVVASSSAAGRYRQHDIGRAARRACALQPRKKIKEGCVRAYECGVPIGLLEVAEDGLRR